MGEEVSKLAEGVLRRQGLVICKVEGDGESKIEDNSGLSELCAQKVNGPFTERPGGWREVS